MMTQADFEQRIKSTLPPRWFGDDDANIVLNGVIAGLANGFAFISNLYDYAKLQTRIKTATDDWLDAISTDFFGTRLLRKTGQTDTSFRNRIIVNMFRERATRNAVKLVLEDLTGRTPVIFEPQRPLDTGAYGVASSLAYGLVGGYGSLLLDYQAFVTAYRPTGSGIPLVAGYGVSVGAYSTPSQIQYGNLNMITGAVTDQDIYDSIASVAPVGTILWTNITI